MSVHAKPRHRGGPGKPCRDAVVADVEGLSDMECAVEMEVAQTASRAAEHAAVLESIGSRAFEAAGVLRRDASGHELLRKAHEVRGLVAHALGVLADLQFQAGRMQALAAIREGGSHLYALALSHANTVHRGTFTPKGSIADQGAELTTIRDRLYTTAQALVSFGLMDASQIKDCKKATGYRPTAADVLMLVEAFKEKWSNIEGKAPVTLPALHDAGSRALELLNAVGLKEQGPVSSSEAATLRQKAFGLFLRSYEDARRAVTYLRHYAGDADDIIPSLYTNRGNRRTRDEASDDVASAVTPAPPGAQAAAAEAVDVDNSAGLPVTSPFTN